MRHERVSPPAGPSIQQSVLSMLADHLSILGRFEAAIGHAEAAVRLAESDGTPLSLIMALAVLPLVYVRRGDFPRVIQASSRALELAQTGQVVHWIPVFKGYLGAAHGITGRSDEGLPLLRSAIEVLRGRQRQVMLHPMLLYAGMACVRAARIDEARHHATEVLALARQQRARSIEAYALRIMGDTASTDREVAETDYRDSLEIATELDMRSFVPAAIRALADSIAEAESVNKRGSTSTWPSRWPRDGDAILVGGGGGGAPRIAQRPSRELMRHSRDSWFSLKLLVEELLMSTRYSEARILLIFPSSNQQNLIS